MIGPQPHPLHDCDDKECYDTMMSERTDLIKARREAEDNLVKTVIQLASALIVLLSGFAVKGEPNLSSSDDAIFILAFLMLCASVIFGLSEHYFSSLAYKSQQETVEKFYTKRISTFREPPANWWVRKLQIAQFFTFAVTLVLLSIIAIRVIGYQNAKERHSAATATATAAAAGTRGECTRQCRPNEFSSPLNATTAAEDKKVE